MDSEIINVRDIVSRFENHLIPVTKPKSSELQRAKSTPNIAKAAEYQANYRSNNTNGLELQQKQKVTRLNRLQKEFFEVEEQLNKYRVYSRDRQINFNDALISLLEDLIEIESDNDGIVTASKQDLLNSYRQLTQKLNSVLPSVLPKRDSEVKRPVQNIKKQSQVDRKGLQILQNQPQTSPNNRIAFRASLGRHKSMENVSRSGKTAQVVNNNADEEDVVAICRNINIHDLRAKFESGSQGAFVPLPKPVYRTLTQSKSMEALHYFEKKREEDSSAVLDNNNNPEDEEETEELQTDESDYQFEESHQGDEPISEQFESLVSELGLEDYKNNEEEIEDAEEQSAVENGHNSDLKVLDVMQNLRPHLQPNGSQDEGVTKV